MYNELTRFYFNFINKNFNYTWSRLRNEREINKISIRSIPVFQCHSFIAYAPIIEMLAKSEKSWIERGKREYVDVAWKVSASFYPKWLHALSLTALITKKTCLRRIPHVVSFFTLSVEYYNASLFRTFCSQSTCFNSTNLKWFNVMGHVEHRVMALFAHAYLAVYFRHWEPCWPL